MSTKKCSKCGRELPATTEFFSPNPTGKYGLYSICRKCKSEDKKYIENYKLRHIKNREADLIRKREYYNQNRERVNFLSRIHQFIRKNKTKQKFCTICNTYTKVELASINHTYTENPEDYIWLCRSCHLLFDKLTNITITR